MEDYTRYSAPMGERMAAVETELKNLKGELHDLYAEIRGLRRALWAFVFSILSGALLFLLAVAVGWIGPK